MSRFGMVITIVMVIILGCYSSLSQKIAYEASFEGSNGPAPFQKPFFFTVAMFWGEFMCLFIYFGSKWWNERTRAHLAINDREPLLLSKINQALMDVKPKPPLYFYLILACFDCTATTLTSIGTLYVSASLAQMLRGSMIVFTGIFSMLILKKRLSSGQWFSLGVVVVALFMVGLSGALQSNSSSSVPFSTTTTIYTTTTPSSVNGRYVSDSSDDAPIPVSKVILGALLILAGSACNAFQNVAEEKLLKAISYAEVDSLEVVGWEGFFGSIISMFIMLPIVQHVNGSLHEDTYDTIIIFRNSWKPVVFFAFGFALALTGFNYFSQQLSKYFSAVVRQLVSTVKVVLVWIITLIIYYAIDEDYGESWNRWSFLQLGGFVLLVVGTLMYRKAKDIPLYAPPIPNF